LNGKDPKKRSFDTSQLHPIQAIETPFVHTELQFILSKYQIIFFTPHGLPPSRGVHDHSIPRLVPENIPPNVHPYHHPFFEKNEI
jgi:hypothetical protein